MSPRPASVTHRGWLPWSGCEKAHSKLISLGVLSDALTFRGNLRGSDYPASREVLFSFIYPINPPEMQNEEQKLMSHALCYPLDILRKLWLSLLTARTRIHNFNPYHMRAKSEPSASYLENETDAITCVTAKDN